MTELGVRARRVVLKALGDEADGLQDDDSLLRLLFARGMTRNELMATEGCGYKTFQEIEGSMRESLRYKRLNDALNRDEASNNVRARELKKHLVWFLVRGCTLADLNHALWYVGRMSEDEWNEDLRKILPWRRR